MAILLYSSFYPQIEEFVIYHVGKIRAILFLFSDYHKMIITF